MKLIISYLIVFATVVQAKHYKGYQVLKLVPESDAALERIQMMLKLPEVSLWKEHGGKKRSFDVMVPPNSYDNFVNILKLRNTAVHIMINNVGLLIEEQMLRNDKARNMATACSRIDNSFYRTLDEIYAELDNFAATYPSLMSVSTIGTTYEGRNIRLLKISSGGNDNREVVWIDCGIHAREWITPASCLFFIDSLSTYGSDSEITSLIDTYDFYVLTVVNPDGYDYTWTDDRMWRKNRVPFSTCTGVDLNRNFDSDFGGPGSSNISCTETYHGLYAFSELETQAVRDVLVGFNGRVKILFTLHSYSQLWMTPYGYTFDLPADYDEMFRVSGIGVAVLEAIYGTQYEYGSSANVIYLAAGVTEDWAYDTLNILYPFSLELRDQGQYGFLLPADQIESTATETWEGIKAAIKSVL